MNRPFLTRQRLCYLLCVLVASYCALFATALRERDGNFYPDSRAPIGPDFDVFFAAGRIVLSGDGERIYEPRRQEAAQVEALGGTPEFFIHYFHPAWMVAPYALLAHLPYLPAYLLAALAMLALLVPTVWLLRGTSKTARDHPFVVGLALLAFWPTYWSVVHGQNALFWLLCLAGLSAGLYQRRDLAAGLWLGLLLGKPQLAVLLVVVLAWQRRWRVVGMAAAVGAILTLLGALLAGPGWPWRFLEAATGTVYNAEVDSTGQLQMAVPGVAARVLGASNPWTTALTAALGLLGLAVAIGVWRGARVGSSDDQLRFGLVVAVTLATSPHALFYDAPLLVLPLLALIDHWRVEAGATGVPRRRALLVVGIFLVGFGWQLWPVTYVQPLAMLPPLVTGCVAWTLARSGRTRAEVVRVGHAPTAPVEPSSVAA